MSKADRLYLYERVTLLGLHDGKGTPHFGADLDWAIAGAVLADLAELGRVETTRGRRNLLIEPIGHDRTGDQVLDEGLRRLRDARRHASVKTWISRLSRIKQLRHLAARQLVRRGILRATERDFFLIFSRRSYPVLDAGPERELIEALRHAILGEDGDVAPRTAILLSIARASRILENVLLKGEIRPRKRRMDEVVSAHPLGAEIAGGIESLRRSRAAAVAAGG